MLKSGTFDLKVKSVHHIVRSNHTQFQENAEEPVQLSTLHSMVATRFPGSNISHVSPRDGSVLLPSLARRALCPRPLK